MLANRRYTPELEVRIADLRDRILTDPIEVLDPPTQHHQFASLVNHGRKLDMDRIPPGSDLYWQLAGTYSEWINETYSDRQPDILIGIANGANRLATTMSASVGAKGAKGLETYKKDSKTVGLTDVARFAIQSADTKPRFVLVVEDVGTTGGTTSTIIPELRELGIPRIEVAHAWIRNTTLKVLDKALIPYGAVIHEPLPTFSQEDCRDLPNGFCNQGILLIPHGS